MEKNGEDESDPRGAVWPQFTPLCGGGRAGGQKHPYLLPSSRPTEAINLSGWSASPHPHLPTQVHASLPLYSHTVLTDPSPRLSAFHFHPGRWAAPLPPHSPGVRETHSAEPQGPGRRKSESPEPKTGSWPSQNRGSPSLLLGSVPQASHLEKRTFQGQIQWCCDNHKCPQTSPKGPWGAPVQTEISSECKMHSELGDRKDPIKTVLCCEFGF